MTNRDREVHRTHDLGEFDRKPVTGGLVPESSRSSPGLTPTDRRKRNPGRVCGCVPGDLRVDDFGAECLEPVEA